MKLLTPFVAAVALSLTAPTYAAVFYLDDEDPGWSTTGAWSQETGGNMRDGDEWYQSSTSNGATATWSLGGLPSGRFVVYASWVPGPNRTPVATYGLSDGHGTINSSLDQTSWSSQDMWREVSGSDNPSGEGYARLSSTAFRVGDGTLALTASDDDAGAGSGGYLMADAARLESVRPNVGAIYVIDDEALPHNDGTFSTTGSWNTHSADPGDHNLLLHYATATDSTATYTFTGLDDGFYRVSAAWTGGGNRPTDATYTIAGVDSMTVNQQTAATGDVFQDVNWQDLFDVVKVSGSTLSIVLSNAAGGAGGTAMIADGMRLERLVPEPSSLVLAALGLWAVGLVALRRGKRSSISR